MLRVRCLLPLLLVLLAPALALAQTITTRTDIFDFRNGIRLGGTPFPAFSGESGECLRGDGTWAECMSGSGAGGDASTNTSTSVDSEITLFSGTGGKTLKRATGSGLGLLTDGVLSTYAGASCTNQFPRSLSASGAATCASVAATDLASTTGAGSTVVLGTSPTFTTSLTTPLALGGSGVGSTLTLQSTSGVGSSDSIRFLVGNNGATEAGRFTTEGRLGLGGATAPTVALQVGTGDDLNWVNSPRALVMSIKQGTSGSPVTTLNPTFKIDRTQDLNDGGVDLSEVNVAALFVNRASGTQRGQAVGMQGIGIYDGSHAEGDAFGGFFVGSSTQRVGGGIFAVGRANAAGVEANAAELVVNNNTGSPETWDPTDGRPTLSALWLNCLTAQCTAAINITNSFGFQFDVGIGFPATNNGGFVGGVANYGIRDNSDAVNFLSIEGNHTKAIQVADQGAGDVLIGTTTSSGQLSVGGTYDTAFAQRVSFTGTLQSSVTSTQNYLSVSPTYTPDGASISNILNVLSNPTLGTFSLNVGTFAGFRGRVDIGAGYAGVASNGFAYDTGSPSIGGSVHFTTYAHFNGAAITGNGNGITSGTVTNYGMLINAISAAPGGGGTLNNTGVRVVVPTGAGAGTETSRGVHISGNGGGDTIWAFQSESTATSQFVGPLLLPNPSAQTIAGGDTITADACGGVKRISSASAVTTNTTNSITAPAAANSGCKMTICNMNAADAITLDHNANIHLTGAGNLALAAGSCVDFLSTGASGVWKQTTAQFAAS